MTGQARRDLSGLPRSVQERIAPRLRSLTHTPQPAGAKKLVGEEDLYRTRIGDYRVVYRIQEGRLVIVIIRIRHRRDAYR
ncbi:MAG TPA: type II toxin-antitoxin system RelE/ParE family toxin [Gemmatimonadota bacterium]|nr:type II toxin-antitoxin system RelE/ParE family toxin [Gemmatimonadota bacterium]